jgi:hypothetical protein
MIVVTRQHEDEEVVEGEILPANELHRPASPRTNTAFDKYLMEQQGLIPEDTSDPHERIIKQVLTAETPDAVLTPVEVLQGRDLIGENIVVIDFELNKSEYDVGSPFYASISALRIPGEPPVVVNCGHKKVIAQLVRLKELGAFPVQVQFMTRGTSKAGGTPMLELTKWSEPEGEAPF